MPHGKNDGTQIFIEFKSTNFILEREKSHRPLEENTSFVTPPGKSNHPIFVFKWYWVRIWNFAKIGSLVSEHYRQADIETVLLT